MNKDNIGNTHLESVQTNKDTWDTAYKLCPEAPKVVETNSATTPNVSTPSASSKGTGSGNTSKPDGSS